jgi:hypothetical protein
MSRWTINVIEFKNTDKYFKKQSNSGIKYEDKINLITQYFPSNDERRFKENLFCLHKNLKNPYIDNIYLLNEKIYTCNELGFSEMPKKIKQINIGKRLMFKYVFKFIKKINLKGYIIISNLDIYFNNSLQNIFYTSLINNKSVYCQLRYEFYKEKRKLKNFHKSFSQDTWIYHSNNQVKNIKKFNYYFGQPGCDTRTNFLLYKQGFTCYNHPLIINCIHVHFSRKRNYKFEHIMKARLHVVPVYKLNSK